MMYNEKLVAAIKNNGKILREFKDAVYLPFGSEYSIYLKNLNSVRAAVSVSIDGTDVGDSREFVVQPNESLTIERFIKNGNLQEGNRLKFIERTEEIEEHKGIGAEDGLISIQFQFEISTDYICSGGVMPCYYPYKNNTQYRCYTTCNTGSISSGSFGTNAIVANDAGITVPGSVSNQQFSTVLPFPVESTKHVMVFKLIGKTEDNQEVQRSITIKKKIKCSTCGKKNKATSKFCSSCGTSLLLV